MTFLIAIQTGFSSLLRGRSRIGVESQMILGVTVCCCRAALSYLRSREKHCHATYKMTKCTLAFAGLFHMSDESLVYSFYRWNLPSNIV